MKKISQFISKYKIYFLILLAIIVLVFAFIKVKDFLYPDDKNTVYGARLNGIDEVTITDNEQKDLISKLKENKDISSASIHIQGKIINIIVIATTKENTVELMEEVSNNFIKEFSSKELAFYDFQFFVKNEDANYNLIGYKNKNSEIIIWNSDEIVSEVKENEEEAE